MEIQRADPQRRRQALAVVLLTLAFGALALWALQRWFREVRSLYGSDAQSLKEQLAFVLSASSAALVVLVLLVGMWLWRIGNHVRGAGRFPPPGARLVRDSVVLHGAAAARRGRLLHVLAAALLICALGLGAATWRLHSLLASTVV